LASKTFTEIGVLGLYAETPLHCGAEGGTGYVDLPVQRERHTQYPVIPGSTLKGVLRDELKDVLAEADLHAVFGREEDKANKVTGNPGGTSFGDGVIVAFPVRSSEAPFHWVTCPFVLERAFRSLGAKVDVKDPERGQAWSAAGGKDVLLEEIRVARKALPSFFGPGGGIDHLLKLLPAGEHFTYTREIFGQRLLILTDADFKEQVETGTEVLTRIKLNFLGTTQNLDESKLPEEDQGRPPSDYKGNMFVEEVVPPETLFLAPLRAGGDLGGKLGTALKERKVIRLGGDETVGRGVTHATFVAREAS
jgi:CRISPR-associated protein Cmr4